MLRTSILERGRKINFLFKSHIPGKNRNLDGMRHCNTVPYSLITRENFDSEHRW
jgi:hypothetical protein